jgi:hypothetical protein
LSAKAAQLNYAHGMKFYNKGWMSQAYAHLKAAHTLSPENKEYSHAFDQIKKQNNGDYGGYKATRPIGRVGNGVCNVCDKCCCSCADAGAGEFTECFCLCCCESMGPALCEGCN